VFTRYLRMSTNPKQGTRILSRIPFWVRVVTEKKLSVSSRSCKHYVTVLMNTVSYHMSSATSNPTLTAIHKLTISFVERPRSDPCDMTHVLMLCNSSRERGRMQVLTTQQYRQIYVNDLLVKNEIVFK